MGRKILRLYNNSKLGHKLLIVFIIVSILPVLFLQSFSFSVYKDNLMKNTNELMQGSLKQIADQVSLNMQSYGNMVYQIYRNEQIIENMNALIDEENTHKAVAYNQIVSQLRQYHDADSGIRAISIVCENGSSVVYDFMTDSSLNTIWGYYQNPFQMPPYREAIDEPGMVITDTMRFSGGENTGYFFHMSKRMFDFERLNLGSIGTVTMTIDQSILNSICNNNEESLERSINFIINEDRSVISYPDEEFTGMQINPELSLEEFVVVSGFLRNRNIAVNQYEDPATGWIYCNVYDVDYMLQDIKKMQNIQITIVFMILLFSMFLIVHIVRTMDQSVRSVVSGMQEVQKGNLDVVVPVQSFREIGTIADNFNDMTVKVKQLIEEVSEANEQKRDAEIRALEAQINPHFLYNTLDTINWMAIEKEEYEISKMLRNLGVILRYSVNKSNQLASMREIEDWIEKYISLNQMRFENAFTYEINVDKETYNVRIYKLLLQPFVENAILHGFKEMEYGGLLRIDIHLSEDKSDLIIIIEDNGKGISSEVLNIFNNREEAIRDDGRSIGLHNAFSRIHMYYGDKASWNINSIVGKGTVITIRLPVEIKAGGNLFENSDS